MKLNEEEVEALHYAKQNNLAGGKTDQGRRAVKGLVRRGALLPVWFGLRGYRITVLGRALYHRHKTAQLKEQDEHVRELADIEQAARELMDECEGTGIFEEWLKIEPLADRLSAALAQLKETTDDPASDGISCPGCGGPTEFDRCVPPNPYYCEDCEQ